MRLKITDLAVLVLIISCIIVSASGAPGASIKGDFPSETGQIPTIYSLFFFKTTIMVPSYLTGNNDYNPGPDDNLYLQPATAEDDAGPDMEVSPGATSGMTEENQPATVGDDAGAEIEVSPGATSGMLPEIQTATAEGNTGPDIEVSPGPTSSIFSKIPSWLLVALVIDVIIAMAILYLAVKKKI